MSKPLVVSIPHHLGSQEALRRLKDGIAHLKATQAGKFAVLDENWEGNRLNFRIAAMAQQAAGFIDVNEDQVVCSVQLPWVLAMLAEKAKTLIQKEGTLLLDKK